MKLQIKVQTANALYVLYGGKITGGNLPIGSYKIKRMTTIKIGEPFTVQYKGKGVTGTLSTDEVTDIRLEKVF